MNKVLGASLLWAAISFTTPTNAYAQDWVEDTINNTHKCVLQLMDSWASKWEARLLCSLSDDLEISILPNGEICILPKKQKVVENMTRIPDDIDWDDKRNEENQDEKQWDYDQTPISIS